MLTTDDELATTAGQTLGQQMAFEDISECVDLRAHLSHHLRTSRGRSNHRRMDLTLAY